MRKFTIARPNDDAARDISAATSSMHAEQHALHRNHGGRLDYQQAAARELLLLAASTVVRIR
ncbi:hypothetical protein DFR70_102399 [Nocardia tenerifensis]|uniref:Uncharacterized protein n=1 Tax=Nocardia tenerifensis TaxID=228006 RepID=A0A318K7P6_9NOCA|nr:hypothetical protein [Nocardia tenerifensis]PXX68714.1 hypothetical protein DFR70_102399 [Nocardia tenerifensis]